MEAFSRFDPNKLNNVYNHWLKVLDLIVMGRGGNELVEKNCGKKESFPPLPVIEHKPDHTDLTAYTIIKQDKEGDDTGKILTGGPVLI